MSAFLACIYLPNTALGSEPKKLSILKNKDPWTGALIHSGTRIEDIYELILAAKEGRLEEVCSEEDAEAIARLAIRFARMGLLMGDPEDIKNKADFLEKLLNEGP